MLIIKIFSPFIKQSLTKDWLFWPMVYSFYLALPPFQYRKLDRMGFRELLSIEPFWLDLSLIQDLRRHWDSCSRSFLFPWGHKTPTLEDVTRLTGLRVHEATLPGHSYTDYRHLVESHLTFSPCGSGPVREVGRSDFFSMVGLSGLYRGQDESTTTFYDRVARQLRGTLSSSKGAQVDLDLCRFLFLL